MLSTYGVDTLSPTVTPRRLWVLLQRLPPGAWPDSAAEASWSVESYLLAALVDRVSELTWLTAAVNSKKGKQPKQPKPIPRPGQKSRRAEPKGAGMGSLMSLMKEV
jgi:hypothetical protein